MCSVAYKQTTVREARSIATILISECEIGPFKNLSIEHITLLGSLLACAFIPA